MKNHRTPRTLDDWRVPTLGYPPLPARRRLRLADWLPLAGLLAVFAFLGVLLAWRG
jgi:hypothetical protein